MSVRRRCLDSDAVTNRADVNQVKTEAEMGVLNGMPFFIPAACSLPPLS
jgi:hypothetical protein